MLGQLKYFNSMVSLSMEFCLPFHTVQLSMSVKLSVCYRYNPTGYVNNYDKNRYLEKISKAAVHLFINTKRKKKYSMVQTEVIMATKSMDHQ